MQAYISHQEEEDRIQAPKKIFGSRMKFLKGNKTKEGCFKLELIEFQMVERIFDQDMKASTLEFVKNKKLSQAWNVFLCF